MHELDFDWVVLLVKSVLVNEDSMESTRRDAGNRSHSVTMPVVSYQVAIEADKHLISLSEENSRFVDLCTSLGQFVHVRILRRADREETLDCDAHPTLSALPVDDPGHHGPRQQHPDSGGEEEGR